MNLISSLLASSRLLSALLIITFLLHFWVALSIPLTVDEAHYALYGNTLSWSYFDHPPLVGWLQAIALQFGEQEWQLRLWAMFSYALTLWLLHGYSLYLTHSLSTANLAALMFSCIPILHVLGIGLVPDTLLLPLSFALIWQAQRTLDHSSWTNWLLMGLLLGLAALSKYTAVLFALGLLLVLITSRQGISWLINARFWLAVMVTAILCLPIIYWNLQHDWISIHYQLNHGRPEQAFEWSNLAQSQASQLLLYTPLVWFMAWLTLLKAPQWWPIISQRQLLLFMVPALAVFTLSSGKEPSLPHWLAFFFTLLLPLIAHYVLCGSKWLVKLTYANLIYGMTLSLLVIILAVFPRITAHLTPNPTQDLIGWKEAAEAAQSLRQSNEPIIVLSWVDASRMAWYARPTPVIVMDHRFDQFDIWFGSPSPTTQGLLILPHDRHKQSWQNHFNECTFLLENSDGFQFLRCQQAKVSP